MENSVAIETVRTWDSDRVAGGQSPKLVSNIGPDGFLRRRVV
jgi:hypothetical protein